MRHANEQSGKQNPWPESHKEEYRGFPVLTAIAPGDKDEHERYDSDDKC
jgi:hypothetical protein